MFEKILVPVDGSEYSRRALENAIQIAQIVEGAIALTYVCVMGTSLVMSSKQEYFYQLEQKKGKKALEEGKKKAEAKNVKVETFLLAGDPVQQIVKIAEEGEFKLIVIGARGISKLKELLLGSVSDGVIRNAPCPVLVMK